jgi:hypothetical protein
MKTPDLIVILSKRLANALAVLDEIAQDIRDELDKLETQQAEPPLTPESVASLPVVGSLTIESPIETQNTSPTSSTSQVGPTEGKQPLSATSRLASLKAAFRAIFDREPNVDDHQYSSILDKYDSQIVTQEDFQRILAAMLEVISPLEAKHSVHLSDFGRLWYGALLSSDNSFAARAERLFSRYAEKKRQKKEFEAMYSLGKEFLGTVVHIASDYALVQLPEGDTGIIHVTAMKKNPREYLDVHEIVAEGQTIRVQVVKADSDARRIELCLVHQ